MSDIPCLHFKNKTIWVETGVKDNRDGIAIAYRFCPVCGTKQTKVIRRDINPRQAAWIGVRKKEGYAGQAQADEL